MASQAYAKAGAGAKEHGFGWLTFAAVMLGFAGVYATIVSPFWALAIFACDVLVIYALARYGGERATRFAE